jgi:hypothetical protein
MNKSRLFASLIVVAVLMGAQVPTAVQASTLTYDVTLSAILGPESGTGSFTINPPPVGSGGTLTAGNLNFEIDHVNFNSTNSSASVSYFYQGSTLVLAGLILNGQAGLDHLFSITLGSNGGIYTFSDNAPADYTFGSAKVSATPLPTSLPLLATGLGVLAMIGWWRKRKVGLYLAA